jgi:hypothetical protein
LAGSFGGRHSFSLAIEGVVQVLETKLREVTSAAGQGLLNHRNATAGAWQYPAGCARSIVLAGSPVIGEMLEFLPVFVSPLERFGGAPLMERTLKVGVGPPRMVDVRLGCGFVGSDTGAQLFTNFGHCSSFGSNVDDACDCT